MENGDGGRETNLWGRRRGQDRGGQEKAGEDKREERQRKKEMGGGQGPFYGEHSECAQDMLLMTIAEDIACQNPKGRSVQMPEY